MSLQGVLFLFVVLTVLDFTRANLWLRRMHEGRMQAPAFIEKQQSPVFKARWNNAKTSFSPGNGCSATDIQKSIISLVDGSSNHHCMGLILTNQMVLTAAHCVSEAPQHGVEGPIKCKHNQLSVNSQHSIENAQFNPGYNKNEQNLHRYDIAVVHLRSPIDSAVPLTCVEHSSCQNTGDCYVYNKLNSNDAIPVRLNTCENLPSNSADIQDCNFMCISNTNKIKKADSGSPVFCRGANNGLYLRGFVSAGNIGNKNIYIAMLSRNYMRFMNYQTGCSEKI